MKLACCLASSGGERGGAGTGDGTAAPGRQAAHLHHGRELVQSVSDILFRHLLWHVQHQHHKRLGWPTRNGDLDTEQNKN